MLMEAMVQRRIGGPLERETRRLPQPQAHQLLLKVRACGVCRTDLHLVDAELPDIRYPLIPGHEVVGEVIAGGADVDCEPGTRVGVPWLGWSCGTCVVRCNPRSWRQRSHFVGGYRLRWSGKLPRQPSTGVW